jgi:hypothetical protein
MGNSGPAGGPLDTLGNNAVDYYLQNGGNQASVDAYFQANPNVDYNKLASDAAQWYTGNAPDAPGAGPVGPPVGGIQPVTGDRNATPWAERNQNVANYFGVAAPPSGQGFNFANYGTTPFAAPPAAGNPWDDLTSPRFRDWFNAELSAGRSPGLHFTGTDPTGAYGTYNTRTEQAALKAEYDKLPPEVQAAYNARYMTLSPAEQGVWRNAFGTDNPEDKFPLGYDPAGQLAQQPQGSYQLEMDMPGWDPSWQTGVGGAPYVWANNAPTPPPGWMPEPAPPPAPRRPPADPRIGSIWY